MLVNRGAHSTRRERSCSIVAMASIVAPLARVAAPVAAAKPRRRAASKAVAAPRRSDKIALASSVAASTSALLYSAPAFAAEVAQLADGSLEDAIPTIAVVASLGVVLYSSAGALKGIAAVLFGNEIEHVPPEQIALGAFELLRERSVALEQHEACSGDRTEHPRGMLVGLEGILQLRLRLLSGLALALECLREHVHCDRKRIDSIPTTGDFAARRVLAGCEAKNELSETVQSFVGVVHAPRFSSWARSHPLAS